jgi:hypothetical protein
MRAFGCEVCGNVLFFENTTCLRCGTAQGFAPWTVPQRLVPGVVDGQEYRWNDTTFRRCANADRIGCNWLLDDDHAFCASCRLTRTRPASDDLDGMVAWERAEACKRRLVYQLWDLGLPLRPRAGGYPHGLTFDLLSSANGPVTTGHADGVVTIDIAEGDDAYREYVRQLLAEPYRTLLGHLRHEIGHWYWEVLVENRPALTRFRELFGDETRDYDQALTEHYSTKNADDWHDAYISDYASAHPWEDWAECFAHYLHMTDTLQTATAFGVEIAGPDLDLAIARDATVAITPQARYADFDRMIAGWLALTFALNAMNRSMGKEDLYPFVLVPTVIEKLRFVAELVAAGR